LLGLSVAALEKATGDAIEAEAIYNALRKLQQPVAAAAAPAAAIMPLHAGELEEIRDVSDLLRSTMGRPALGGGSQAQVLRGEWNDEEVAIKMSPKNRTDRQLELLRAEAQLHWQVSRHPCIAPVRAFGVDRSYRTALLVMKLARGGSLAGAIDSGRLSAPSCNALLLRMLWEVAQGLAYLHSLGIVHRDVACRNFLLDERDHAMLSDLGYARKLATDKDYYRSREEERPLAWLSPEELADGVCSAASDVYMFGMSAWEALSRRARFYDASEVGELRRRVLAGARPQRDTLKARGVSEAAIEVVYACLHERPAQRPTMAQVVAQLDAVLGTELRGGDAAAAAATRERVANVAGDAAVTERIELMLVKIEGLQRVVDELNDRARK
jgi:serine/threonine protein kinase